MDSEITWRDVAAAVADLYTQHSMGGQLHIVVDDFNVDDSHVQWCYDNRVNNYHEWDEVTERAWRLLSQASRTQRLKAVRRWGQEFPEQYAVWRRNLSNPEMPA